MPWLERMLDRHPIRLFFFGAGLVTLVIIVVTLLDFILVT